MKIRAKIKALREQMGLTQDDLARLSGVSIQSIRRYESKDDANITLDILGKIAKALNSNVVYFVSQCLPMSPSENELSPNGVILSPNMSPNAEFLSPNSKKVSSIPQSPILSIYPFMMRCLQVREMGVLTRNALAFMRASTRHF